MNRLLPAPLLSIALFALWLLLNLSVSPGNLLLGALLAILAPILLAPLRPQHAHVKRPWVVAKLIGRVGLDVITSNLVDDKLAKQQLVSDLLGIERLNGSRTVSIARSDSLELAEHYLAIEQVRYGARLSTVGQQKIPAMLEAHWRDDADLADPKAALAASMEFIRSGVEA